MVFSSRWGLGFEVSIEFGLSLLGLLGLVTVVHPNTSPCINFELLNKYELC